MKHLFYILLIVCLISGCEKNDKDYRFGTAAPTVVHLNSFPLNTGNKWKYHTEVILKDSAGNISDIHKYDNYWEVVSDTIINGFACSKIYQLDSNYTGATHFSHSYYANRPDGFYGMAVENFGSMFFLRKSQEAVLTEQNLFSNFSHPTQTDTIFIPDTALALLKFPSALNDTWSSHEYYQGQFKRKWVGYQTINTIAGTFNCIKLQAFFDNDNDSIPDSHTSAVYQYFSDKGLIAETHLDTAFFSGGSIRIVNFSTLLVAINF